MDGKIETLKVLFRDVDNIVKFTGRKRIILASHIPAAYRRTRLFSQRRSLADVSCAFIRWLLCRRLTPYIISIK